MKVIWFVVLLFCFACVIVVQAPFIQGATQAVNATSGSGISAAGRMNTKTFLRDELIFDLHILREVLEDAHPGLYWYNSTSSIDSIFNYVERSLSEEESEIAFYRKTLHLISQINCGHTLLDASNPLSDDLWGHIDRYPFEVVILDQKLIYAGTDSQYPIKTGYEILTINGHDAGSLIESMLQYTVGDGFILSGRKRMVERRFGFYYALLYGFSENYTVRYVNDENDVLSINIPIRSSAGEMAENRSDLPAITFAYHDAQRSGYLKIPSFSGANDQLGANFKSQISRAFDSLEAASAESLIIDLRDNRGGSDELGLVLLSHLTKEPIVAFKQMYLRSIDAPLLKTYSNLDADIFPKLSSLTKKMSDSVYVLTDEEGLLPYPPSSPVFEGNVYVLINGNTFSTAADVAAILYSRNRATFIGEETGGGYYGNTSGLLTQITLPKTGLRLRLPLVRYETNVEKVLPFGRGVIPHLEFEVSQEDMKSNEDGMLAYTLNLAGQN